MMIQGPNRASWFQLTAEIPPKCQKAKSCLRLATKAIPSLIAVKKALMAIPASTKIVGLICDFFSELIMKTKPAEMAAPKTEKAVVSRVDIFGKKVKQRVNMKAAPALIPNKPESAIGFLVTLCIKAPETARADPISIAPRTRGILIETMIR